MRAAGSRLLSLTQAVVFVVARRSPSLRGSRFVLSSRHFIGRPVPWKPRAESVLNQLNVMADSSEGKTATPLDESGAEGSAAEGAPDSVEKAGGESAPELSTKGEEEASKVASSDSGEAEAVETSGKDVSGSGQTTSEAEEKGNKELKVEESGTGQDDAVIIESPSSTEAAGGSGEGERDKTPPPDKESSSPPPKQGGGGGGLGAFFKRFFSQGPVKDRAYYESLSLEEKRKLYKCGHNYVTLDKVETWEEASRGSTVPGKQKSRQSTYLHNPILNQKVSLWRGDITRLEIGAIVNAANSSLLGGGGVDGAIHRAASSSLTDECATLNGCDTGDAKLTSGHRLPAKHVLHTVGPMNGSERKLRSCYERCLELALDNGIRSVAFPCIATGIYGYPNEDAAHVALEITRKWLEEHTDKFDRIIFCVFLKVDNSIYSELLSHYFPTEAAEVVSEAMETTDSGEGEGTPANGEEKEEPPPSSPSAAAAAVGKEEVDGPTAPTLERSITEPGPPSSTDTKPKPPAADQPPPPTDQPNTEPEDSATAVAIETSQPPEEASTETTTKAAADSTTSTEKMEVEEEGGNSPKKPSMEVEERGENSPKKPRMDT